MKVLVGLSVVAMATVLVAAQDPSVTAPTDPNKPDWAYALGPAAPARGAGGRAGGAPGQPGTPAAGPPAANAAGAPPAAARGGRNADPTPVTLPGSSVTVPRSELGGMYGPTDWFPEDHPPMPDVVARGHAPATQGAAGVGACGFCHLPNGYGRPENASLAGLPKDYIVQQLADFKNGLRKSSEPRLRDFMGPYAQALTDAEIAQVSSYFSSMPLKPWIRVVEADVIPKTRVQGNMFHLLDDGTTEPIGTRIVEAPENEEAEALRSPRTGFVAYVPVGAIKKGELLVTTGGGKTLPCATCHGPDLKGVGPIPGLAGRGPSYLGRQIYDILQGTRHGTMATLMKPVVQNLTNEDIVDILAYTASRPR